MTDLLLALSILITVLACLHILSHARDPMAMLAWILTVFLFPLSGGLLYFLFVFRRRFPRLNKNQNRLGPIEIHSHDRESDPLFRTMSHLSQHPTSQGNQVDILPDADEALDIICQAIRAAEHTIFVEYYIVASDNVAVLITDELSAAHKRGVKVCLMYDAQGSRLPLLHNGNFFARLKKAGLRVAGFLPAKKFFKRYNLNHRNHRKLLIVDGKIAFSGGTNLGGDYFGRWHIRQMRDYTFRFQGPICFELQKVFLKDWRFASRQKVEMNPTPPPSQGHAQIQLIPSGPDNKIPLFYTTMLQLLATAKSSIKCVTPYFIPDQGLSQALMLAARRGVKVELILPSKIDWMPVLWATRSYLDDLLQAGVVIYAYPHVLLHAKMLLVDHSSMLVGSSNLDPRSFYTNFELDFLIKEADLVRQADDLFVHEISRSKLFAADEFLKRSRWRRIGENFCRLFSPLL